MHIRKKVFYIHVYKHKNCHFDLHDIIMTLKIQSRSLKVVYYNWQNFKVMIFLLFLLLAGHTVTSQSYRRNIPWCVHVRARQDKRQHICVTNKSYYWQSLLLKTKFKHKENRHASRQHKQTDRQADNTSSQESRQADREVE